MSISEQLDNVPGLPKRNPYIFGPIPWDKLDQREIEDHIEIIGTLREDIGTFRRLLEREDLSEKLRILINNQLILDSGCIEQCMAQIRRRRSEREEKTNAGTTKSLPRPGQGSFQL